MDKDSVKEMFEERKELKDYQKIKMNSKGTLEVKGLKNNYLLDFQLGYAGAYVKTVSLICDAKQKYHTRFKGGFLARVDVNAPPHMCEDGKMWKNHIHVYIEDDEEGNPIYETHKLESYSEHLFHDLSGNNIMLDFFKLCNISLPTGAKIQEVM